MSTWTLRDAHAVEKTLAEWGLAGLERRLANQATDRVSFRSPGSDYDGEPLFAYGDTVQIRRDGALWFAGRVVKVPRVGEAKAEGLRYELAGPWWYLEDLVFQQDWKQLQDFDDDASGLVNVSRSRVVIGQDVDGEKISGAAQIAEVLNFAIAQGRPLQIGTIEPDADIPWDERQDPSCAEVIRRVLRWTPDAVAYFDYTTTPPTLHVRHRASLPAVSVPINQGEPVQSVHLAPRHDLQRSVVVLKYEQTATVNGAEFTQIVKDQYPPDVDENAIGALTMTMELSGGNATFQTQRITTSPIQENSVNWWKEKLPWLKSLGNIQISGGTRTPDDKPNELKKGTISAWMGKESGLVEVKANLSYERWQDPDSPYDSTGNPIVEKKSVVSIVTRVRGTDAATQSFSRLRRFTPGEPVPVGLAQKLYASVGVLPYEGKLLLKEEECSGGLRPGSALHLTGGRSEWVTMQAVVQHVEEKIDSGETQIEFGPAKHLGADDLLGLLRVNRTRVTTYRATERSQGKPSGKAEMEGVDDLPVENASPGAGKTSRLMLLAESGGGVGKVTLDVADCDDKELKVREIEICDEGVAKKIRVLCSEPY